MNNIPAIQNEQTQLERLSAQRELYSFAKKLYVIQLIGNVPIPVILSLLALFIHQLDAIAAAYGITFFLVDILIITPVIPKTKRKAASIQELFDCDVLQIENSPLKTAKDITVEEVLTNYNAHEKIKSNVEKVRDWYPKEIGEVNIGIARLICQRTNCWWDSKIRGKYCSLVKGISIVIPVILIIIGVARDLKFESIMLISSALIPFFQFCSKEFNDNMDACERLDKAHSYIASLWESVLNKSVDVSKLSNKSRSIQDEIFELRSKSPLILDGIYNRFRENDESLMSKTAEILVNEVKKANADF